MGSSRRGCGPGGGPRFDYAKLVSAVRGGASLREVAEHFGCSYHTVYNACIIHGVERPGRWPGRRKAVRA